MLRYEKKWFFIETAGLFAADQLLKTYAEQNLDKKRRTETGRAGRAQESA